MDTWTSPWWQSAAAVAAALALGCATTVAPERVATTPCWPPPPAEPRVVYVQSITGPADLGLRASLWGRLAKALTGGTRRSEAFIKPFGVALDEAGNLCVTDTGAAQVVFFDRQRKAYRRWNQVGPYAFVSPVAVARQNGLFYVADSGLGRVVVFNEQGQLRYEIAAPLERPSGLVIVDDRLYVADAQAHCILVFDLTGHLQSRWGARGSGPGEFNFPTHLAADTQRRLYVTDSLNCRLQVFDPTGKFLTAIGSLGDGSGHFSRPKGVAVDGGGHIYVADALFDNLQIFNLEAQFLLNVGTAGSGPGEFWMPTGIAIGRDNRIYVADAYNCRVQVFQYLERP
jgi:DNA-binding beta-propeller fold protein YncE